MNQFGFFHRLGLKYPLIQGAMAGISDGTLVAAVSAAGGLGILATAGLSVEGATAEINKIRELTTKPFGINILLLDKNAEAMAELACQEKVPVVATGAGNPSKFLEQWKKHNITVIPVVPSATIARKMEAAGVDAVVAEGAEAGGHVGTINTMALIPQTVDAVNIPVIAAGGIGDGRGIAAAFMLGASGVQLGTRFLAATECKIDSNYKRALIQAKDTDTVLITRPNGHIARVLRPELTEQLPEKNKAAIPVEIPAPGREKASRPGDADQSIMMAGQIAGLITVEQSCKEIIENLFTQAKKQLAGLNTAGIVG